MRHTTGRKPEDSTYEFRNNSKPKVLVIGDYHYDESSVYAVAELITLLSRQYNILYYREYPAISLQAFESQERQYITTLERLIDKPTLQNPTEQKLTQILDTYPQIRNLTQEEKGVLLSDILKYNPTVAGINILIPALKTFQVPCCFIEDPSLEEQMNKLLSTTKSGNDTFSKLVSIEQKRTDKMYELCWEHYSEQTRNSNTEKPILLILHDGMAHVHAIMNRFSKNNSFEIFGCRVYSNQGQLLTVNEESLNYATEELQDKGNPVTNFLLKKDQKGKYSSIEWEKWIDDNFISGHHTQLTNKDTTLMPKDNTARKHLPTHLSSTALGTEALLPSFCNLTTIFMSILVVGAAILYFQNNYINTTPNSSRGIG